VDTSVALTLLVVLSALTLLAAFLLLFVTLRRREATPTELGAAIAETWTRLRLGEAIGKIELQAQEIHNNQKTLEQMLRTPAGRASFGELSLEAVFTPYLLDVMNSEGAEIGIHAHLQTSMVERAGVKPRLTPDASSDDCSPNAVNGYGVLLTGYKPDEQARIVDASINGLTGNGFPAPTTFCAGYSATNPSVQALLDGRGFSASFACQHDKKPQANGGAWGILEVIGRCRPLCACSHRHQAHATVKKSVSPSSASGEGLGLMLNLINVTC
jgi:hypothetical protein